LKESIDIQRETCGWDVPPEPPDEVIVSSPAAEFDPHPLGEHVEHHSIVVFKPSKLAQVQKEGILIPGRT
jgi:hypothetical protein